MKSTRTLLAGVIVAVMTGSAGVANAETLLFTFSVPSDPLYLDGSWEQSSDPTPIIYFTGFYTIVPLFDTNGYYFSSPYYVTIVEYHAAFDQGGGFSTLGGTGGEYGYGALLYSGTESNPIFSPGVFYLDYNGNPATFTITAVAAPEPTTWALMLAGFAGLGAALRMRRGKLAAA